MTISDCQQVIDAYLEWLRKGLSVEVTGEACELTTPFLDRHNDHLQIYCLRRNGKIILSDDGYILSDLKSSGLDFSTQRRKAILEATLNGLGIKEQDGQLVVESSEKTLGQKIHSLIQGMLAVNDMFVMARQRVATLFWEDVQDYLEEHNVRYSPRVKVSGRSGFDHNIDFLIPKSRKRPERFIQAINAPSKNTITAYLFSLTDTLKARGSNSEAFAFMNDRERAVGGDVIEALESYKVAPAIWSRREEYVQALAE